MALLAPMADAEFEELERQLMRIEGSQAEWITLSSVDGFLAAIACSPATIPAEEWVGHVIGNPPEFDSTADAKVAARLMVRRWNEIVASCRSEPVEFYPILQLDTDDTPLGEIWAEGFAEGIRLRPSSWSPLCEHSACAAMLLPIMALADPDVFLSIEPRKKKRALERIRMTDALLDVVPALLAASRILRETGSLDSVPRLDKLAAQAGELATTANVGRNDPCPCGSGKKFKRCCGGA